jgi:hypothetical protein
MRRRKKVPLPLVDPERTAFGMPRTRCHCAECVAYCKVLPGYLIPEDLGRMVPAGVDPLEWAKDHLRASPGAIVGDMSSGRRWRIPTLVPARAEGGACIYLDGHDRCGIHAQAPFGCAFFDHQSGGAAFSLQGLREVAAAMADPGSLYHRIWHALHAAGLTAPAPEEGRERMRQSATRQAPWWKRRKKRR